ncbi:replication initiation factor domain-containing protein [Pandoraea fibrosis]|nr:replication initiation factor domain-containing protein [Pandoraea fibrosis]
MQKTNIDWFGFRSKDTPDVMVSALSEVIPEKFDISLTQRKAGWRSFEKSFDVWVTDKYGDPDTDCARVGMAMTGGESVKGWSMFSLSGEGCAWVNDWGKAMDVCTDQLDRFELKRVDIALDRFDGSHWHEVDEAWKAGEFSPPGGGTKPKAKPIDSRRPQDGRTYYVGSRESDKFYRGYEKGLQILGPQIAAAQARNSEGFDAADYLFQDGFRVDRSSGKPTPVAFELRDWWRDEVEFKPSHGPLPLDLVEQRDQYFAGAFPYLGRVLPNVDPQPFVMRRERMPQIELDKALKVMQEQFGNTLFTALRAYKGDIGAVWEKIVGRKHNRALVDAGVLLVDHD